MKLLTATAQTQGARSNDYDWTVEGELIRVDVVCGRDQRDPDAGCGCGRGFAGMSSQRATTTALVRDVPLSHPDLCLALTASLAAAGYHLSPDEIAAEADALIEAASTFPVGAVVERRLDILQVRALIEP